MFKRYTVFLFILVLLMPVAAHAQDPDAGWRVEEAHSVPDLINGLSVPSRTHLAPDGRHIAYEDREDDFILLCVIDVADLTPRCAFMPRETRYSFNAVELFPPLNWSPDARQIATVGMTFRFFNDTDLGLIDLSEPQPTFTLLIDDGYEGNLLNMPTGSSIEASPAFSPDGAQLAFEQSVGVLDTTLTMISVMDLTTGAIEPITRLPGYEEYERDLGSALSLEWSPDGSTLAFSLRHQRFDPMYDGVWLVDVTSGALTQLVTRDELLPLYRTIYPGIPAENIDIIAPVRWSPDGSRLLFFAGAPFAYTGQLWVFWLDVESGAIHPVPLPTTEIDRDNARGVWPMQAAWSPDGSTLLVSARLIVSPDEPRMLIESDEAPATALYLIEVATEERTLLGHLPQSMGPLFHAYWGPNNDVFAGGYYLKLARQAGVGE